MGCLGDGRTPQKSLTASAIVGCAGVNTADRSGDCRSPDGTSDVPFPWRHAWVVPTITGSNTIAYRLTQPPRNDLPLALTTLPRPSHTPDTLRLAARLNAGDLALRSQAPRAASLHRAPTPYLLERSALKTTPSHQQIQPAQGLDLELFAPPECSQLVLESQVARKPSTSACRRRRIGVTLHHLGQLDPFPRAIPAGFHPVRHNNGIATNRTADPHCLADILR